MPKEIQPTATIESQFRVDRPVHPSIKPNLSIDDGAIKQASELLTHRPKSREQAIAWIHSAEKARREQVFFGVLAISAHPVVLLGKIGVAIIDGRPTNYDNPVGFLGTNGEIVGYSTAPKIRSLQHGADENIGRFQSTLFQGALQKSIDFKDKRTIKYIGNFLRRTGIDETPQLWAIMMGKMAGVGLRAYTMDELADLQFLYRYYSHQINNLHINHPMAVSQAQLDGSALFSLYTATGRKDLSPLTRLTLDIMYIDDANPVDDVRIFWASVKTHLKGVGAR